MKVMGMARRLTPATATACQLQEKRKGVHNSIYQLLFDGCPRLESRMVCKAGTVGGRWDAYGNALTASSSVSAGPFMRPPGRTTVYVIPLFLSKFSPA